MFLFCFIWSPFVLAVRGYFPGYGPPVPRRIDLTHNIQNGIPVFPGLIRFNVTFNRYTTPKGVRIQAEDIVMSSHSGTHLDAPVHMYPGGWTLDQIPEDQLSGPGVMIDVQTQVSKNRSYQVTITDLVSWERRTGSSKYWDDSALFRGTDENPIYPGLAPETAEWLVRMRNIKGVGTDSVSFDSSLESTGTHVVLGSANKWGIECLANLERLRHPFGFTVDVLPMKILGSSAAPARVFVYY